MLHVLPMVLVPVLAVALSQAVAAQLTPDPRSWRVVIANDTCPDVTWGYTEEQVRQAFSDLIAAHLDEMKRTDSLPADCRDHYNLMAFVEAEAFLEKHPERRDEFIRRVRDGRICVSPFLCNTLWGFQSVEGFLRAFYPARRMECEYGIPIDVAGHTELPSLPWGVASLLAGCGIRWTSVPFLDYDSTFKGLTNPPLFRFVGPDGSEVRVVLDNWASHKASYAQGAYLLADRKRVEAEWLPHYEQMGSAYPMRTVLASGTHSDISPQSWEQARGFADAIARADEAGPSAARLVNGTLAQFCADADAVDKREPFLPRLRGCFGHSWELWPVSLANVASAMREGERSFLAAESLVTLASQASPEFGSLTRADREKGEWYLAMLADHAWNGTDPENKRHNAQLRRRWADGLTRIGADLTAKSLDRLGFHSDARKLTVYNPLSFVDDVLVVCDAPAGMGGVMAGGKRVVSQLVHDDGRQRLAFVAARVPAFGFREFTLVREPSEASGQALSAAQDTLEGPFYRLVVDQATGGLAHFVHKGSGQDLVLPGAGHTLGQTVYHAGQEHDLADVKSEVVALGPVLARVRIAGRMGDIRVTTFATLYADLDRVDFDTRIDKPVTTGEQRLLHFFPIGAGAEDLRIETTGAVLRPRPQPAGDLLPGADTRRFAVQGFVDYSPVGRVGVTVASLDAFALRLDQGALAFEALGNDQNWKEVIRDQGGDTEFRFRYRLRAHGQGFDQASAMAWSRRCAAPLVLAHGCVAPKWRNRAWLEVDPARAIATCLKPADGDAAGQAIVRLWETAGRTGPTELIACGYRSAAETDLLERDRGSLKSVRGRVQVNMRGCGFSSVRLQR